MKTIQCTLTSAILPRIIPTNIFVSWKSSGQIGRTEPAAADSPKLSFNSNFRIKKSPSDNTKITICINAVNEKGYSVKLSEKELEIPDSVFSKKIYQHVTCNSRIGDFIVELSLQVDKNYIENVDVDTEKDIKTYTELINSIDPHSETEKQPEKYYNAFKLIKKIAEQPLSELKGNDAELLNDLSILGNKSKQIKAKYDLVVNTILSMSEKKYLYVLPNGEVKGYESFHDSDAERYPLIGMTICKYLNNILQDDMGFSDEEIDMHLLKIFSLFSGLFSNKDIEDRGYFYLISNLMFIFRYKTLYVKAKLPSSIPVLFMVYRELLTRTIESQIKEIKNITMPSKFVYWYKCTMNKIKEMHPPISTVKQIYDYVIRFYDRKILLEWLNSDNPSDPDTSILYEQIEGEWVYTKSLLYIIENATKLVKKKVKMTTIPEICRGSICSNILNKLVELKRLSASQKQLNAINEEDKYKKDFPTITEYVEEFSNFKNTDNIPKDLPAPKIY